jgi:hypothetical protein
MEENKNPTVPDLELPADLFEPEDLEVTPEQKIDSTTEPAPEDGQDTPPNSSEGDVQAGSESEEDDVRVKELYDFWKQNNVINVDLEGPATIDNLEKAALAQRQAEINYYQSLPVKNAADDARPFIEYAMSKPGVTLDELKEFFEMSKPVVIGEKDLEQEEKAEEYLRSLYKSAEYEDEFVEERIDMLKDSKTLTKEALREYKRDTDARKAFQEQKLQESRESKKATELESQQFVDNFNSSLKEIDWNDQRKAEVVQVYSSGFYKSAIDILRSMPKAMIQMLDFVSHLDVEKGEFKMDDFLKRYESKVTEKVKDNFNRSFSNSLGKQSAVIPNTEEDDIDYEFADL